MPLPANGRPYTVPKKLQFLEGFLGRSCCRKWPQPRLRPVTVESRFRPPGRKAVPHRPYGSFCSPEGVNRCHDLVARTVIRIVHLKIDVRRCSEILARGMNRRRAAEAATIPPCFGRESSRRLIQHTKAIFQILLRIEPNEMLWQGRRLDKEEPPHVLRRKLLIGVRRYIVNVGAMSMSQTFFTPMGKSRHRRWATRPPRSRAPTKMVVSTVLVRTYPTPPLIELSNPRHGS
jgi:hypothetical protein